VTGPPLVPPKDSKNVTETVRNVWEVFSGQDISPPFEGPSDYVDVRDVARLFLWSVEHPETANGERYIAFGGYGSGHQIAGTLREHYPGRRDIIKDYPVGEHGDYSIDASKAIKATGQDFIKYEKSVLDAAKAFEVYL
jgi:nucleoside-diphosphate-sugar epimerase